MFDTSPFKNYRIQITRGLGLGYSSVGGLIDGIPTFGIITFSSLFLLIIKGHLGDLGLGSFGGRTYGGQSQ